MSRSRRKNPIHGRTTCESEKDDKRDSNRKFRRIIRQMVKKSSEKLPKFKEVSNVWLFGKDGKVYNKGITKKDFRK
jgi:hypothetical protein